MASPRKVMGQDLPGPQVTAAGLRLAAVWLAGPALALVIASDLLGWAVARALGMGCFGLVCLLG